MTESEIANNYWLPIECGAMSTGSEKYNLSAGDINLIKEKLKEIEAYEDMMEVKEPPTIIKDKDTYDTIKKVFPDAKVVKKWNNGVNVQKPRGCKTL